MKEKNWSISFETEDYENNRERLIQEAIDAVRNTAPGYFVNVVTPASLGHPDDFLAKALQKQFGSAIASKFIGECSCGGYVLRVWKNEPENESRLRKRSAP